MLFDQPQVKFNLAMQSISTGSTYHGRPQLLAAKALYAVGLTDKCFDVLCRLKAAKSRLPGVDLLRAKCRMRKSLMIEAKEMLKEELRLHPKCEEAHRMLSKLDGFNLRDGGDYDPEFVELFEAVEAYTMVGQARLFALFQAAKNICVNDIPGSFVECGVAGGGSSGMLAAIIERYSRRERRLFCCDTFAGMPTPTLHDRHDGIHADDYGWGDGTCAAPLSSLIEIAERLGVREHIRPVEGLFADTLPEIRPEVGCIALLHLDGDWYSSTMDILDNLYSQVIEGAYLQADDYGFWEGCRQAIEEFQLRLGAPLDWKDIDGAGVFAWKRQENRLLAQ
jgi:O-methyltransferase